MSKELKTIVKDKYTEVVTRQSACCGPRSCDEQLESAFSEDYRQLEGYVADADLGLGCGLPTDHAALQPGETVLDLGAGAGNDVFVARRLVGEHGRVIGLDMTEAMIERANANNIKLGYENVEFVLGDIEAMPLPDDSIDVAISNCVLNLVPDKEQAYRELYRILRPGGRFAISDIVLNGDLSEPMRRAAALYAGCVSGALQREEYLQLIEKAGFTGLRVAKEKLVGLPDELLLQHLDPSELATFRRSGASIYSITVCGKKPVD